MKILGITTSDRTAPYWLITTDTGDFPVAVSHCDPIHMHRVAAALCARDAEARAIIADLITQVTELSADHVPFDEARVAVQVAKQWLGETE